MRPLALVTGASRGLGAAIADRLAHDGYEVLRVSRSGPLVADISQPSGRDHVVEAVAARGRLDVLVNNVGTNIRRPTTEMLFGDYRHIMATNTDAAFDLCRRLQPALLRGTHPCIVQVSSVAATRTVRTSSAAYAMSKGALEALTRFLAVEWGPQGIRVNAVAPWYVTTELVEEVLSDPARREAILDATPLGRVGTPEELADAVAFLVGNRWVSGVVLPVDGGFSARGS